MAGFTLVIAVLGSGVVSVTSLLASTFVEAQPADQTKIFEQFLLQPTIQNQLRAMVIDKEPDPLRAECSDLKVLDAGEINIVDPPRFEVRGGLQLVKAAWVHTFSVDRCGQKTRRRLFIKYDPSSNKLVPTGLLPGDFHGDLRLEVDAANIAIPSIMSSAHCSDRKTLFMLDVQLLGPRVNGAWSEIWKAQACGNVVYERLDYTPSAPGTNITAQPYTPAAPEPSH